MYASFSVVPINRAIVSLFLNTYIDLVFSANNRRSLKSFYREGTDKYINDECKDEFHDKRKSFFKELIDTGRLIIHYTDYSIEELIGAIKFLKKNSNVGLIGIDYIQLISSLKKGNLSRQEELKKISLMLKDCAIDTGLPIIQNAQFNRTVQSAEDMSPQAIGEAGDIERASNAVIGIFNHGEKMTMKILKGREMGMGHESCFSLNGNTGKIFRGNTSDYDPPRKQTKGNEISYGRISK